MNIMKYADSARRNVETPSGEKQRKMKLIIFFKKIYPTWAVKEMLASGRT